MSIIIDDENAKTYERIKEITVSIKGGQILYQAEFNSEKKFTDLPYYCFSNDEATSIEELNFNNLKKCDIKDKFKYMVAFLGDFADTQETDNRLTKEFNTWHNSPTNIEIKFIDKCFREKIFVGKIEKIFYKGFSPQISGTS